MKISNRGFTIVELLIVVVVIAILAAITIVAFNGVQNRANESALQAEVAQAGKKLSAYAVENADTFPADKTAFLTAAGIVESPSSPYLYYTSSDQRHFCASMTKQQLSYAYASRASGTVKGRCVENLAANPSASGPTAAAFGAAGSTHAPTSSRAIGTGQARNGTTSFRALVTGSGQMSLMARPVANTRLNNGEIISWSYWVYSTRAGSAYNILEGNRQSDGSYFNNTAAITIPANTWTQFSRSWTTTADVNIGQVGFYNLQVVSGDSVWLDEITIQKTPEPYPYADGDSANGFWTGAAHNSTSVAPLSL